MQIIYSQTHEEREKSSVIQEYLDSVPKSKKFYLKFAPAVTKLFARNYFLAFVLLILIHAQEIAILLSYRQQIGQQNDGYTSYFIQYINYTLLVNLLNQATSKSSAELGIFYFTLIINCLILGLILLLFAFYASSQYEIKKIRSLSMSMSCLISIYPYLFFLPALKSSFIMVNQYQGTDVMFGAFNIILTWIIGFLICLHDYDYSFKERDKLSKRFSYYEVWKFILQGMLPFFLEFSNEKILTIYSCLYSLQKVIIYFLDQTYYNETISCFYSMIITYYCTNCIMFLFYLISPDLFNFTLLMLLSIPFSYQMGKVIYEYLQNKAFSQCIGKQDLSNLPPNQLDIYIRLLNKNLNFFYEDYIDGGQGIIFENLYVNHQINCDSDDYRCFCHDFRRKENKLEFDEYIGQDFRRKYVMFYVVNLYEHYLNANSKKHYANSVTFAYISFLFEIMKISTKSFNMIYIIQQRLISENANLRDLFIQQILMYRIKQEFQHFFSNPTYQNQRLFVMAPILFDENMASMKLLLKEQLVNTGIFYDYLCQNYIDLKLVDHYARILFSNLVDLKKQILYLYDLSPENLELQQYTMHYSNLLEFENSKITSFKKNSKNLSKRMLQPQDRNIQVFSKNACIVYASLIKKDGLIKKVSNTFSNIYGIENDLIIGKTLNSLIPKGLYNTHDDIISNFKNKGSMNIINKEQRMVFGLNGEGFIIPLTIRLKLENMNDDFGVCSLLTSVNHDKEYLFISNEGQIMDITKKLYNLIFKDISSINDLRRFDIKHLIPLIWGIQEVNEYDKTYYSILVVSKYLMKTKDTKVQDLKSHQKMQEVVDAISLEDDIYSICFKVCIITTSIGLNFKFIEIDNFKKEDNLFKKKGHIQNLKHCLNDILKNEADIKFKELSDLVSAQKGSNENQMLAHNVYDLGKIDQSQVYNEDVDSSFYKYMRSSLQNKMQSSANIKEIEENSRHSHQYNNPKVQQKLHKNQLYSAGGNLIQSSPPQPAAKQYRMDTHEDERNLFQIMEENNGFMLDSNTPRDKSNYSNLISPRILQSQAAFGDSAPLPPTTDRLRLQENHPLLTDVGAPSTTTHRGSQFPYSQNGASLLSLQSPVSQTNIMVKAGKNELAFFPNNKYNENLLANNTNNNLNDNFFSNIKQNKTGSNNSTPRDYITSQKQSDLHTNSSDNSEPPNQQQLGQIVIKRHESRSKTEKFVEVQDKNNKNVQIIKVEHKINQEQHQLLKELDQDDIDSRYLRIGSQDNNFKVVKIENHYNLTPQHAHKQYLVNKEIKEVDEHEKMDFHDQVNQNEMITSYKTLMKMNQNQRQQKTMQINQIIQHQNTSRSLMTYNQEMKLSLDKEIFKKESRDIIHLNSKKFEDNQNCEMKLSVEHKESIDENNLDSEEDENITEGRKNKNIHLSITQQVENNNDQSSVQSSNKTSEQTRRKTIIRKIKSHHISTGLRAMVYMGIIAFFVFISVSVLLYAQNYKSYTQYINDFNKVNQASIMFVDVLSVVKVFSYLGLVSSQSYYAEDQVYSFTRLQYYITQFKNFFITFLDDDVNQKYYDYLLNEPFKMSLFHKEGDYFYPIIQKNETQIQAISQFMYIIQQIREVDFDGSNLYFLWTNMHEYKNSMLAMQTLIEEQARQQFENINLMQIMMLIIILIITSILIFTVLPLSVYNTMRREEILKLFGCFHPEKLQRIVDIIESSVNKLDLIQFYSKMRSFKKYQKLLQSTNNIHSTVKPSQNNTTKSKKVKESKQDVHGNPNMHAKLQKEIYSKVSSGGNNQQKNQHLPTNETQQLSSHGIGNIHQGQSLIPSQFNKKQFYQSTHDATPVNTKMQIKRQPQKRTRQIASFNTLTRLDVKLASFAVFIIIIMMIPPILNILFSNSYMSEGKITLSERIKVLNTIVQVIQNQAAHYNIWFDSLIYDFNVVNKNDLLSYQSLQNVTLTNPQIISELQSILEINQERKDQSSYEDFYLRILKDDICSALKKYPDQFYTNSTVTQCQTLNKGVMTRGFIMASKEFLDELTSYYTIYTDSLTKVSTVLDQMYANQKLRDINKSVVFLLDTFNSLDGYSQRSQESYNNYINDISLYLFVFYVIVVILIFFSGWTHVFFKLYREFDSTKKLLSLFNMNVILENAFLMQFLKSNDFGIK